MAAEPEVTPADISAGLAVCRCDMVDVEPVPEMPQIIRCIGCGGWVRLEIMGERDLTDALRAFPPRPDDDE